MSTDLYESFNEQYMNINTKLKKRFMRKPNILEATNEFVALAIQCEHSEQPSFAGQCYIGAAKCEASAGNFFGEAEYYLAAARQYILAEKKLRSLKFYSGERENLEAATGCYMQALNKYPDKSPVATAILQELANNLHTLNYKLESLHYYLQALDRIEDKNMKLTCMKNLLNIQIECGIYEDALNTANQIAESDYILSEDILSDIQVSRILLASLVEYSENKKPDSLKQLFADVLNDSDELPFNIDLMLKLQSIIFSTSTNDANSLISVAVDAKKFLTFHQKELLDALVLKLENDVP